MRYEVSRRPNKLSASCLFFPFQRVGKSKQQTMHHTTTCRETVVQKDRYSELKRQRDLEDEVIIRTVHLANSIHTVVFLIGKYANVGVMASSLVCIKLLQHGIASPWADKSNATFKSSISFLFSAIGFCFDSRSAQKVGGIYLLFLKVMAL